MRLINKIIKSRSSGLKIRLIWVCEMGGCARWGCTDLFIDMNSTSRGFNGSSYFQPQIAFLYVDSGSARQGYDFHRTRFISLLSLSREFVPQSSIYFILLSQLLLYRVAGLTKPVKSTSTGIKSPATLFKRYHHQL